MSTWTQVWPVCWWFAPVTDAVVEPGWWWAVEEGGGGGGGGGLANRGAGNTRKSGLYIERGDVTGCEWVDSACIRFNK